MNQYISIQTNAKTKSVTMQVFDPIAKDWVYHLFTGKNLRVALQKAIEELDNWVHYCGICNEFVENHEHGEFYNNAGICETCFDKL